MSDIEYSDLLFEISRKLDVDELQRLLFMCRKEIAKGSERNIRDVLTLFEELERNNRLGIDRLDTMKEILTQMKKRSLLKKVEEFEIRRKAQSVGIVSSLKRAATCIKGAIKLVCNFRTIAGGLLVVSSGMALRKCSTLDEFVEAFSKVVLISYSKLVEISEGSLCFIVQAETSSALKELWDIYKSGTLRNRLQEFLLTDEIKQLASGEDVEVTVYIDEQEYKAAYLDVMLLQTQASDVKEQERRRRNSDSFLCFKPNEDGVTSMNLNFERQRRQILLEENEKLKTEIAEAENVQRRLFWHEEENAQETEDLERPRERRRRNSDSNLYCKSRDEETARSKKEVGTKYLDSEKLAFVQSYLQNIQEAHSMTTERSDSGIRTHGEPSDFEMQAISDHPFCMKDLSGNVIRQLNARLNDDFQAERDIKQAFGIKDRFLSRMGIFELIELFPDTPVKLFKDVLEALQLYDLVDLLPDKPEKPPPVRSLRPARPLQEIEKLRNTTDPRPTTYHSNVAVLIITDDKNSDTEGIERFFKGLSSKSDVTVHVFQSRTTTSVPFEKVKFVDLKSLFKRRGQDKRSKRETEKEMEKHKTAVSAVVERWIHNQGNSSLFAVFVTLKSIVLSDFGVPWESPFLQSVMEKLEFGIPDKVKFVMVYPSPLSVHLPPETVMITTSDSGETLQTLMLEILNKRWQTLDLISMMNELYRSLRVKCAQGHGFSLTNNLSSRPRFKKEEDLTD